MVFYLNMFSITTIELCYFEITERVHYKSRSQYSYRANLRFVVRAGVLREGFLYIYLYITHTSVSEKNLLT